MERLGKIREGGVETIVLVYEESDIGESKKPLTKDDAFEILERRISSILAELKYLKEAFQIIHELPPCYIGMIGRNQKCKNPIAGQCNCKFAP